MELERWPASRWVEISNYPEISADTSNAELAKIADDDLAVAADQGVAVDREELIDRLARLRAELTEH